MFFLDKRESLFNPQSGQLLSVILFILPQLHCYVSCKDCSLAWDDFGTKWDFCTTATKARTSSINDLSGRDASQIPANQPYTGTKPARNQSHWLLPFRFATDLKRKAGINPRIRNGINAPNTPPDDPLLAKAMSIFESSFCLKSDCTTLDISTYLILSRRIRNLSWWYRKIESISRNTGLGRSLRLCACYEHKELDYLSKSSRNTNRFLYEPLYPQKLPFWCHFGPNQFPFPISPIKELYCTTA